MKTKYFGITALIAVLIFQICCGNVQGILTASNNNNNNFITKFDAEAMAKKNLNDFVLVRKRAKWNLGREFVFQKSDDPINVFLTIGLHQSPGEAEAVALDYLNEISIRMTEGPLVGLTIGDKLWWWSPNSDSNKVTNILFIRENALFILSSHSFTKLKDLAKTIDDDITERATYITIKESISVPKVISIASAKSSLKEGESTKITIHATDPNNEPLEYQTQPGLAKLETDPENVFTYVASRDHVPEPFFGSHDIKIVVINKSNIVSDIFIITINIIP